MCGRCLPAVLCRNRVRSPESGRSRTLGGEYNSPCWSNSLKGETQRPMLGIGGEANGALYGLATSMPSKICWYNVELWLPKSSRTSTSSFISSTNSFLGTLYSSQQVTALTVCDDITSSAVSKHSSSTTSVTSLIGIARMWPSMQIQAPSARVPLNTMVSPGRASLACTIAAMWYNTIFSALARSRILGSMRTSFSRLSLWLMSSGRRRNRLSSLASMSRFSKRCLRYALTFTC
mmetsp:Transcript_908/g.2084  ORF Transcript_908/g.2084 Transcript_908/m.2084 type:complete len:234 (+) Transcript_908:168-869(+)